MAEQNNFAISEFINNKKAESNYEPIKNKVDNVETMITMAIQVVNEKLATMTMQVLKLQWEYNKMLIEALKKN